MQCSERGFFGGRMRIRRVWCVFIVLLVLVGCVRSEKETYLQGDRKLARGDFQGAYETFQGVVARGSCSSWAGRALLKLAWMERVVYHRPKKALEYCEELTSGDFPYVLKRRAAFLMAQIQAEDLNRPLEGLKVLEGLKKKPGDFQLERLMVEYAVKGGDLKRAARLARGFLEEGEGLENLRFALVLADLLEGAGDYKDAEELYNRVRTQARGDLVWEAVMGLAGLREDQGRLKEALTLLRELKKNGYKPYLVEVKMRHIIRRLREERG